jgi:hypothetical protein
MCNLTLEEHTLWISGNRVLMRMFGPEREKVTGSWTKLYNEELHNIYPSPNIIMVIK